MSYRAYTQTDRQTARQTDRQTDRHTDRQRRQVLYTCGLNRKYNEPTHKFFKQLCWHSIYERYFNQVNFMVLKIWSTATSPLSDLVTLQTH